LSTWLVPVTLKKHQPNATAQLLLLPRRISHYGYRRH